MARKGAEPCSTVASAPGGIYKANSDDDGRHGCGPATTRSKQSPARPAPAGNGRTRASAPPRRPGAGIIQTRHPMTKRLCAAAWTLAVLLSWPLLGAAPAAAANVVLLLMDDAA